MTTTTGAPDAKASVTAAAASNYCDRQHKITINPRRIVYKKRLRRRWPPATTTSRRRLLLSIILLVLVNEIHWFGVAGADRVAADNVLLVEEYNDDEGGGGGSKIPISNLSSDNLNKTPISSNIGSSSGHYLDKIDNLERSVAAVLIKVAYGTTSTTKRSIPDNSYVPSLTTIATPPLTTLRYLEKSQHQQQINLHHRNYELDLERDHALPTSAPNADILKSNSNPTYPNPNRHHNHDRNRHRHLVNSTPSPSVHNLQKKGPPTNPMYSIDMPSYSPPSRSFLTPPLPPEYTNPFADKPTLRGTNNEGGIANTGGGAYINRRPIPPPSLMPGQERIPFRPPDLNGSGGSIDILPSSALNGGGKAAPAQYPEDGQRKKALNTPSLKVNNKMESNSGGYDKNTGGSIAQNNIPLLDTSLPATNNETVSNPNGGIHFQGISRILSGSNGRKEDIPEVLLRTSATIRPGFNKTSSSPIKQTTDGSKNPNINQSKSNNRNSDGEISRSDLTGISDLIDKTKADDEPGENGDGGGGGGGGGIDDNISLSDNDGFDMFAAEPQPKVKMSTKSTENPNNDEAASYSTQIHNLANVNNEKSLLLTTSTPSGQVSNVKDITAGTAKTTGATWTVAWNIHVYLSAILFTILAVYSIFKMIFYDKLTHLFNQSYFICIHLILIIICMTRIFYLCYDAYNIHSSFHLFLSEILLNLPATFLTISFSVLILFLLIRSLNHKNNRYSALIRPLTVVVGSSVLVGLCITLHYVESYTTSNNQQLYYYQQQLYRNGGRGGSNTNGHQLQPPIAPPRVLSLICQIIYIFVCLSLGLLYLYIYRILKRVLRSKSQNYMHGYQNLSYAIHITIATALLYVLLAALQIYGALSISTNRPLITSSSEIDWLQWGYQFSLRLIEIAIITLMSWVAGLKTGGNPGVLQREKAAADTHNVSGFALFPCTSSSSQEHFETDYPAVCNANTNLHTYTLRTGKPIYDDNFALNSLAGNSSSSGSQSNAQQRLPSNDFQIQNANGGDFVRSYETSSLRSASHHLHNHAGGHKTVGGGRDKNAAAAAADTHNMSGFALFPCTSGSSPEHFETDYPTVCNANTSLHTHTMRTGKPIVYDDNFAGNGSSGGSQSNAQQQQRLSGNNDFQIPNSTTAASGNDFVRSYETSSLRSASRHHHNHAGHKSGVNSRIFQRDKCTAAAAAAADAQKNGFALFPCTSSSSQEHFEADYPPVATAAAKSNHTLRSGKPIYDDNFVLAAAQPPPQRISSASKNDFLIANSSGGDFVRSYKTSSLRSGARHPHKHSPQILDTQSGHNSDYLDDPQTDHYENPNFELRTTRKKSDNCYSEPLNTHGGGGGGSSGHGMML